MLGHATGSIFKRRRKVVLMLNEVRKRKKKKKHLCPEDNVNETKCRMENLEKLKRIQTQGLEP